MEEFRLYADQLEALAAAQQSERPNRELLDRVLDGEPARKLRALVPGEKLRLAGAFFTSRELAARAAALLAEGAPEDAVYFDPTCGAADLLLACSRYVPVQSDFHGTHRAWQRQLRGFDLHPEFIRAAKARMILAALSRGVELPANGVHVTAAFPSIVVDDCLSHRSAFQQATHIIVNPPFGAIEAPDGCAWASGRVSAAAVFMEACVRYATAGTVVVAILPEVLRSGARYHKWRQHITNRASVDLVESYGLFDKWTDVDVFLLRLRIEEKTRAQSPNDAIWWSEELCKSKAALSDYFHVCVGPVVDYRDPKRGAWHPFVSPRTVPPWADIAELEQSRRFEGRLIEPPFVVVRRTSRPGDKHRAVGSIVRGTRPVAVENHMLVLTPRDRKLSTCRKLIQLFRRAETNDWLNERIRCRHLTVAALRSLPWLED